MASGTLQQNEEKIKTTVVRAKQKNGDIYVLERVTIYDSVKKYNRIVSTKLLSKIPKGSDTPVKTRPKRAKCEIQSSKSNIINASRMHTGMMDIIDFIGKQSGIDDAIYANTDLGSAQKIISIARYILATDGCTFPGIHTFQLSHPLPYSYPITEDVYRELFDRLGRDELLSQRFFESRVSAFGGLEAIAFDSTTISTYSTNQTEARQGFNKDHDGLDTIKWLTLYDVMHKMPIAFTKMSGNIPDVTTQINAIKEMKVLGINTKELITDNGYYSESNMTELELSGLKFITMAKTNLKWIRPEIDSRLNEFDSVRNACSFEPGTHYITVVLMKTFTRKRKYASIKKNEPKDSETEFTKRIYLHIYYNRVKAAEDRIAFENDLLELKGQLESGYKLEDLKESAQRKAQKYLIINPRSKKVSFNEKTCAEAKKYSGYFVLVCSKERNGEIALIKYRKREYIEENYRNGKQHTDMNHIRCQTPDMLRGRMFVQFIALCYHEYLGYLVRNLKSESAKIIANKEGKYSFNVIRSEQKMLSWVQKKSLYLQLRWFDVIEEVKVSSQLKKSRWSTETLETDRLYLERLGMDPSKI